MTPQFMQIQVQGIFLKEILYLLVPDSIFPYRNRKALFQGRKEIDFKVLLSWLCHQCYTCLMTCSLAKFSCFYKSKPLTVVLLSYSEHHFQVRCHLLFLSSRLPWFCGAATLVEEDLVKMVPCTSPFFMAFICLITYQDHSFVAGICKI